MKLNLTACSAQRPDRRAISRCLSEISSDIDDSYARELTDIFLQGDPIEIDIDDKNSSSAFRSLRKLSIDYDII